MSSVTLNRLPLLSSLGFPVQTVRYDGQVTVTASVSQAELEAALAAAPTDMLEDNDRTLRERIALALAGNRDFLALANPTNAQNAAQIKALTRQMNGLMRLVTGALDAVD